MLHRLPAALALLLTLALAGCSDDPEPRIADPTETPTTPTTKPVTDPPDPTSTPEPERETAQEFIRRWAAIEREMENSGETAGYRALSDDCEGCDKLATTVETYYEAGGSISWDGWDILRVAPFDRTRGEYLVSVESAPTRYRTSRGGPIQRLTGGPAEWVIQLRKEGASWVVTDKDELVG